ncbi:MAG: DUF5666 domain-containing protein [Candidatus Thiodiazotropha sp.]
MSLRFSSRILLSLTTLSLLLTACGGGGGGDDSGGTTSTDSGTTGSNITTQGVITGFGSVYVNGVRYHTGSSDFTIDDNPGLESDLRLGMVVTVTGTLNDDGTGNASSIVFDNEVQGPVTNLITNPDGQTLTFTVLGITVQVDRVETSFHDISFDTLAEGDLVEASGFYDGSLVLNATYLERKSSFTPGASEVELKGSVSQHGNGEFQLNGIPVMYDPSGAGTLLLDLPNGLSDGMFVEVKGTLDSSGNLQAVRISREDSSSFDDNQSKVSLEGIITDYVDDSNFRISGTLIDASNAVFTPATLTLGNGIKVEAEGPMVNGVLQAITLGARGGDGVEISARVQSVTATGNSLTLNLLNGQVTVHTDSRTRMEDKTDAVDSLSLNDLSSGDFLEVRGLIDGSDRVLLTELRRDDPDDVILQGPVEGFEAHNSITILGVTLFVSPSTRYEDINDNPFSADAFYSGLSVGSLVKMKDSEPGDGTANEVEFEN